MFDVAIIGAGPAGSLTARHLAERGHHVVVLEEHEAPGWPVHCTGLVGPEAFPEFDLPRSLILAQSDAARFWGAAGHSVPVRSGRVNAVVINRRGLDEHLAERARAAGADLRFDCRADDVTVEADRVRIELREAPPIQARLCVLACGANYRFHRRLGLGLPDLFLQSAQIETRVSRDAGDRGPIRARDRAGRVRLAGAPPARRPAARPHRPDERESRGRAFRQFSRALAARARLDPAALPRPRLKVLPLGPVRRSYADRVLAVGDAAGLVKPTTGGGIYYGLLSGSMAAAVAGDALVRDRLDARGLRQSRIGWRRRLGQEIRVGLAFRRIAARLSDQSIDELIELARVDGVVPLLERTASFNWHRKAAIALLGHPAVRRIVFRSWARSAGTI